MIFDVAQHEKSRSRISRIGIRENPIPKLTLLHKIRISEKLHIRLRTYYFVYYLIIIKVIAAGTHVIFGVFLDWQLFKKLMRTIFPLIISGLFFGIFLVVNGSIVLGDKDAHQGKFLNSDSFNTKKWYM